MEFSDDIGKLQRLMAASSAGIARRQAIMDNLVIKADDKLIKGEWVSLMSQSTMMNLDGAEVYGYEHEKSI